MNSPDPWSIIALDEYGDVVWPRPRYRHPFYQEVPSWVTPADGERRLLFDGTFIGADPRFPDVTRELELLDDEWTRLYRELAVQAGELTREPGGGYHYTTQAEYDAHPPDPALVSLWKSLVKPKFQEWVRYRGHLGLGAWQNKLDQLRATVRSAGFKIYVGADMTNTNQRTGLTAEVAPIIAPATGGISVKKELDDKQVLRVEICVDGKCYRTQMDLAPAFALVMQKLGSLHKSMHAQDTTVGGTIDAAVGEAADGMVAALVGRHVETICGSFLDDIGNAIKGAAGGIAGGISSTFKSLKGPIATAAAAAAGAGAALIPGVGPVAAPLAAKLANDLVNSAAGDETAKKSVDSAKKEAADNPVLATALAEAQKAVAKSTVEHHVRHATRRAARGHRGAQQQIASVAQEAEKGDPAAKAVADLVADAMKSEWGAKLWEKVTGRGPNVVSGASYVVVGSFWDDVKDAVLTVTGTKATNQFIKDNNLQGVVGLAGQAVATYYGGPAAGAAAKAIGPSIMNLGVEDKKKAQAAHADVQGVKAAAQQAGPHMAQAVDAAHGAMRHTATAYHIAQILRDAQSGLPQAQQALASLRAAANSGDFKATRALHAAQMINREQAPSAPLSAPGTPAVGQWYDLTGVVVGCSACEAAQRAHVGAWVDLIGSVVDETRERARSFASTKPGNAAGAIQTADGRFAARGFPNLDAAIDWLQRSTGRREDFIYAAAYEKGSDGSAYIQAEEFGGAKAPTPSGEVIRREPATTSGLY